MTIKTTSLLNYLSKPRTLVTTFGLTLFLTACFGVVMYIGNFGIIDEMYTADDITQHILAMSPDQRRMHAWMTGTLDVLYPFAYASFFIGVAIRYFGKFGKFLIIPSLLAIPADLTEGFAQIMLLTGYPEYMGLKQVMTILKLTVFVAGLAITLMGLCIGLRTYLTQRAT